MKRLNLTLSGRLFKEIQDEAEKKGIPPTSLVIGNLEDLYLRAEAIDYEGILKIISDEARQKPLEKPFLLSELPSFSELIISSAKKAHISPSQVRSRIGICFNSLVIKGKVGNVKRTTRVDGRSKTSGAMYINTSEKTGADYPANPVTGTH